MPRSKSSNNWLREHFDDYWVKLSQEKGYRARSAFKLEELHEKDNLLSNVSNIVDLGCAPGGWCQVARRIVPAQVRVIGLDILPMEPIAGVEFIQGDFRESSVLKELLLVVNSAKIDLVLSDIAPNLSGMPAVDQPRIMYLAELALDFCHQCLKPNGNYAVKLFQGAGFDEYIQQLRNSFHKVIMRKPKASRARSREVYAVAISYKG
ncbi:23S rRNA (uridine(2552)-2'-O)-methyltransferase [hydrothermal vent metagenome]|uniref:23S rRNA (Uridine(2552)-2'-O)-methyltransferase n=1 Tax=hydrothermal vent metagenome TaxID=652676 RepID=A0A3B0VCQ2_9ZZZZ